MPIMRELSDTVCESRDCARYVPRAYKTPTAWCGVGVQSLLFE